MRTFRSIILTAVAIAFASSASFCELKAQAPVVGNITFTGGVNLDTGSASNATAVTAWHGLAPGDKPQVQTRDGSFATFVTPGDGATFFAPWSFNSGSIPSFWSVDGFTFDLTLSSLVSQTGTPGNGALQASGTGTVSGNNFAATPGTWNFTTQDPSADSQFSFSAATAAVPEASTTLLLALGGAGLLAARLLRTKARLA